jgi:hypothetical protein
MKMSNGFEVIASGCVGIKYGHVPGHSYHDVEVGVGRKGRKFRAVVLETWGSAQGQDEEHGRRKVVARGENALDALAECVSRAHAAGIGKAGKEDGGAYLPQAANQCGDELEEAMAQKTEYRAYDTTTEYLGPVRTSIREAQSDCDAHNQGCVQQGGYGSAIVVQRLDGGNRCADLDGNPVWPPHGQSTGAARWRD